MNKNKFMSYLLMVLTLVIGVGSMYLMISYAIDILNAVEDFIKLNDLAKLSSCGATLPPQLSGIASQSKVIVPVALYGLPILLIVISVLMFLAGFFYRKGKTEDEAKKREEIEREMVRKAAERVAREKAKKAEAAASKAMEEELETEEEPEEEMIIPKKKKK